ncbi:MAG TPA: hypothetical protein VGO04_10415 [Ensifer sp.]|jgi:hypothetical protein|uniref:hypothetical protein n=1 Tax=Ensifer sp. TaxID=1872086 RepID=UPI002E1470F4|nr:hypothetical protein [Ensifer sp.]
MVGGDWFRSAALVVLALVMAAVACGSAFAERLLIIYENESTQPATMEIAKGISARLSEAERHVEIYAEHLDLVRFGSEGDRQRLIAYVRAKYADKPMDAVLVVGPGVLRLVLGARGAFAPGVPIVFGGIRQPPQDLPDDVTGVISRFDVAGTLDLARRLQPDAKALTIMTGSATFDRDWEKTAREIAGEHYSGFDIDYVSGLSLDGFKAKAAALSADSALLILTIFADADGVSYVPREAASKVAASSGAPVYSVYSSYFDGTILAGHVSTFEAVGRSGDGVSGPDAL